MEKEENALDKKIEERNAKIEKIVSDNELREVISHAEMGSEDAILARFFLVPPEHGGFSDISAHDYLVDECKAIVNEKLEEAAENREFINDWRLYESVGEEVRRDALQAGEEGIYRAPAPTVEDDIEQDRQDAIEEMQRSREGV